MAHLISVVVVARPSPLRESLVALLGSIPMITAIQQADDATSGLHLAENSHPALVLIDGSLPGGEAWTVLRQVRARWPHTQSVVLTDTVQLRRRAEAAGANRALLKGFPAAKLSLMLEQLLRQGA